MRKYGSLVLTLFFVSGAFADDLKTIDVSGKNAPPPKDGIQHPKYQPESVAADQQTGSAGANAYPTEDAEHSGDVEIELSTRRDSNGVSLEYNGAIRGPSLDRSKSWTPVRESI